MLRLPAWALCCCLAVADGLIGCDTGCDKEDGAAQRYAGGETSPTCTSYQTGGFNDPYLAIPPGRRWDIEHGLRQEPRLIQSYLAFSERPLANDQNTAESAGNQLVIEEVTDEFVRVRNDTCEDFWLRLVLEVDVPAAECLETSQPLPAGGAGGAGGG